MCKFVGTASRERVAVALANGTRLYQSSDLMRSPKSTWVVRESFYPRGRAHSRRLQRFVRRSLGPLLTARFDRLLERAGSRIDRECSRSTIKRRMSHDRFRINDHAFRLPFLVLDGIVSLCRLAGSHLYSPSDSARLETFRNLVSDLSKGQSARQAEPHRSSGGVRSGWPSSSLQAFRRLEGGGNHRQGGRC